MIRTAGRDRRSGAAVVEFAISAPVLFLMVFACIEFARANMIRNTIENAAYEGARSGILPGATSENCKAVAQELVRIIGVKEYSIAVEPEVIREDSQEVTVAVEVPMTVVNGYITPRFYLGRMLRASITLPRETGHGNGADVGSGSGKGKGKGKGK